MSHYLPFFTRTGHQLQQSACGRFIRESEHSAEPTCDVCARYLTQELQEEADLWQAMGYVEIRPGVMGPKEQR